MLRRRIKLLLSALLMGVLLTGCSSFNMSVKDLQSKLNGLDVVIRTFDEESKVIDKVNGKSVMIERDTTFDTETSEGSNKDSSVIKISIGKNVMHHVGSSLIMAEDGLQDIFEEYAKTVDITNTDRSVPFINSMIDSFKNVTTGKAKVILIRSQNGTPLATYLGNEVSIFSPDIPKTTVLLVDGQVLLIYRCDYTIYDTALLME